MANINGTVQVAAPPDDSVDRDRPSGRIINEVSILLGFAVLVSFVDVRANSTGATSVLMGDTWSLATLARESCV